MEAQASFDSLPLELKVQIFSLLDQHSFLEISEVCKSWKAIKEGFFFTDEVILLDEPLRKKRRLGDGFLFYVSGVS